MYTLIRLLPRPHLLAQQRPVLLAAETFHKFKRFAFECAALHLTWFAFDAVRQLLRHALTRPGDAAPASNV